jgi:dsDNA-specific endonuclease/ATPase MutS2
MSEKFKGEPPKDKTKDGFPHIDLHGKKVSEVNDLVTKFVSQYLAGGQTILKITHGHGTGQVKAELTRVLTNLKNHGLIDDFRFPIGMANPPFLFVDIN